MNYSSFVSDLVASPDISLNQLEANHPIGVHIVHSSMGLLCEVIELYQARRLEDEENLLEELGDVEFYSTYAASSIGYSDSRDIVPGSLLDGFTNHTVDTYIDGLILYATDMTDLAKKYAFYGQEFNYTLYLASMRGFVLYLSLLYNTLGVDQLDVRQNNINKLQKRYEDGFSTEASELRKDKS